MMSLRERNRRNAMRLTQRTALDLFIERGFDDVTVDEIAEVVGMAASTIYRHFATKEDIVLWDEDDDDLDKALLRALNGQPPLAALRHAFIEALASRYDDDLDFHLRRIQYIYATEQLHAAAVERDYRDTAELREFLSLVLTDADRSAAPVLAGAAMLALDTAFDRWQDADGQEPLGDLIGEAFDTLARLDRLR